MMEPLSNTFLYNLYRNFNKYGVSALEGVPKLHLQQLLDFLNKQIQERYTEAQLQEAANPSYSTPKDYTGERWKYFASLSGNLKDYHRCKIQLLLFLFPDWERYIELFRHLNYSDMDRISFLNSVSMGLIITTPQLTLTGDFNTAKIEEVTRSARMQFDNLIVNPKTYQPLKGFPAYLIRDEGYRKLIIDWELNPPRLGIGETYFNEYLSKYKEFEDESQTIAAALIAKGEYTWMLPDEESCFDSFHKNRSWIFEDDYPSAAFFQLCSDFIRWLKELNEKSIVSSISVNPAMDDNAKRPDTKNETLNFPDVFVSTEAFDRFIDILIDQNCISESNHYWLNKKVSLLVGLLRSLRSKGYTKYELPIKDTEYYIQTYFNKEVSTSIVKSPSVQRSELKFLPDFP